MSERFGLSHRQVVRDVNEGKVVPDATRAPTTARGINAVRGRRNDQRVTIDDGRAQLLDSLVNAAGVVGQQVQRNHDRKQAIAGYNWAGTEKGRQEVDEASGSLGEILFGPNPKMRAAQERIVKDQTDQAATKLYQDLADFGHKMQPEEWQEHVAKELGSRLEKYTDEGIKDQITQRFGQNLTAVAREYEKSHHMFLQNEERETFMGSVIQSADMAHRDLASGDPNRAMDGVQRMQEALVKPEGMTDKAYQTALSTVIKQQLTQGRGGLYEAAMQTGKLDDLPEEEKADLKAAKDLFDAQNSEQFIVQMQALDNFAKVTGDVGATADLARKLQQINPEAFPNGVEPFIEEAYERQLEIIAEKQRAARARGMYGQADPGMQRESTPEERQQAATEWLDGTARRALQLELSNKYAREGTIMPDDVEITPAAVNDWLVRNSAQWGRTWAANNMVVDRVSQIGRTVLNYIDKPEMTAEHATELASQLDSIMNLRKQSPALFDKHFTPEESARMATLHQQMSFEGTAPYEVMARFREQERLRERGIEFKLTPEEINGGAELVAEAFVREHGDWSINPFRHFGGIASATLQTGAEALKAISPFHDAEASNIAVAYLNLATLDPQLKEQLDTVSRQYYNDAYERTGDHELAFNEAVARLNKNSLVIGRDSVFGSTGKFVLEGNRVNETSYGGDFDRYLQGIDEDPMFREKLSAEFNLPPDFSLRSGMNRYVVNPDGSGATIWLRNADGIETPVPVAVPTRPEHILPTANERRLESLRSGVTSALTEVLGLPQQQ